MQDRKREYNCECEGQSNCSDANLTRQVKLLDGPVATWVKVCRIAERISCAPRLRELGILEGSNLYIMNNSDPLLLLAGDTRIAIDRETAAGIIVARDNLDD